jgi:putative ABC transport system ATP-binding protein
MEPLISFRNVNHWFGQGPLRKQILFDVSTDIFPGEIVILTGPSGSGKTTTLTLAGGLRSVQQGSVRIFGEELREAQVDQFVQVRRRIGFIFQAHNLLDSLTVYQNVEMSLALHGPLNSSSRTRILNLLDDVGLAAHADKFPRQLSAGQKQRVAIARALIGNPQIILADEPTASLDKKSGREVVELLHDLARKQQCAILLVTHDNRILDIADRMLTLEDGRLSSSAMGLASSAGQILNSLAVINRRGDLLRHMENLTDAQFVRLLEESTGELDQLLRVVDLAQNQLSESMLDQTLEGFTLKVGQLLEAERSTIFLVDHDRQLLRSKVAQHSGDKPIEIVVPLGQGIAGHVARTGETLNIPDAYANPLFNRESDLRTGYRTRNILCVPIYNRSRTIIAVAQILNKRDNRPFTTEDETRFDNFVSSIAVVLETCLRLKGS